MTTPKNIILDYDHRIETAGRYYMVHRSEWFTDEHGTKWVKFTPYQDSGRSVENKNEVIILVDRIHRIIKYATE